MSYLCYQHGSGTQPVGTGGKAAGGVKLATFLQPLWRLRMSGAIPLLPVYTFIAWTATTLPHSTSTPPERVTRGAPRISSLLPGFCWKKTRNSNALSGDLLQTRLNSCMKSFENCLIKRSVDPRQVRRKTFPVAALTHKHLMQLQPRTVSEVPAHSKLAQAERFDLYAGGAQFVSRTQYSLYWLTSFVDFLILSSQIPA
jgi:hypothetical protein